MEENTYRSNILNKVNRFVQENEEMLLDNFILRGDYYLELDLKGSPKITNLVEGIFTLEDLDNLFNKEDTVYLYVNELGINMALVQRSNPVFINRYSDILGEIEMCLN